MKCEQCDLDFFRVYKLLVGSRQLCSNCFKHYHGFTPPANCAVTELDEDVKSCDLCNSQATGEWFDLFGYLVCERCYSQNKYLEQKEEDMKCENCGETMHSAYWVDVPKENEDGMKTIIVCDSCYKVLNNPTWPLSTQTSTTAIVPATQTTTPTVKQFYCKTCFTKVDEGVTHCKECRAFATLMASMGDGSGQWFETIEIDVLRQYCTSPEEWFWTLPGAQHTDLNDARESNYTFFDHGSNILAVGHLDIAGTSLDRTIFKYDVSEKGHHYVFNHNLDDRLGVFIIHHLLPQQYGIQFDILLTTNEESGGTTAQHFQDAWLALPEEQRKKYDWIIEFDRRGTDVVLYQYENKDLREKVEEFRKVGQGSFSDISRLSRMGCKAMNWGTGYEAEHTRRHYAILENTLFMVEGFIGFYEKYKNEHLAHSHVESNYSGYGRYVGYYGYGEYDEWEGYGGRHGTSWTTQPRTCPECKQDVQFTYTVGQKKVCAKCYSKLTNGMKVDKSDQPIVCSSCGKEKDYVHVRNQKYICFDCIVKDYSTEEPLDDLEDIDVEWVCEECSEVADSLVYENGVTLCLECHDRAKQQVEANGVVFCDYCGMSEQPGKLFEINGSKLCKNCYGY